ncbi:hypothetical protein ABB02_01688 [Clostridiaceae bacterium JG1575]|nr:hypothetical protein ABB02_01688 [Clostridiaceae bacterium JG1575]
MIRLIALDLDGTLLDAKGQVSNENARALEHAMAQGITVTIATGRMPAGVLPLARKLQLKAPLIVMNGSLVADFWRREVIRSVPIQGADLLGLMELLQESSAEANYYDAHTLYVAKGIERYRRMLYHGWDEGRFRLQQIDQDFPLQRVAEEAAEGIYKVFVFCEGAQRDALRTLLVQQGRWSVCSSSPNNLEIGAPGATKGQGLRALADHLGIPLAQVLAIGDSENDLSMFEVAGVSVAMGNAPRGIAQKARFVTASHDLHGVAQALRQWTDTKE